MWVDPEACVNISVVTGWLTTGPEWIEAGVTAGSVTTRTECVTQPSAYYAFNNVIQKTPVYREYLVPNGRVDPGDDITVRLETYGTTYVQAYVTTPHRTSTSPIVQVYMNPDNVYEGQFGIEGTISAADEYSSIPMSKFTNMKIKQGTSWINLPNSAKVDTPNTREGFLGQKCPGNSFVAGSVMSLDCNVVAAANQAPSVSVQKISLSTNAPQTISLDATDADRDYLKYYLVKLPTNGFLNHNNRAEKIPNTDGDSSQLVYTPAHATPRSDTITYSVTDGRDGHTREGTITIMGPTPSATTRPGAVSDFAASLSGNTISFSWSHPNNGGSPITSYKVERSRDTTAWALHNTYSETTTSFSYVRHQGYDQYFRVFANNAVGQSATSNVVHVHIPDTTGPVVTVSKPADGATVTTPGVAVGGHISEPQNSGIRDIAVAVNGTLRNEPVTTSVLAAGSSVSFESVLTGLQNGNYLVNVSASNGDGYSGNASASVTVAVPAARTLESFSEDFEGANMSSWILATEEDEFWSVRDSPLVKVPGSKAGNKVGGTEDCDNVCTMTMVDKVDLTQMSKPKLSFYRYVGAGADISNSEGIYVYASTNGGVTWTQLGNFTANQAKDDGAWHLEEYNLAGYASSSGFKVRFEARSNSDYEDMELDDIRIYDAATATNAIPLVGSGNSTTYGGGVSTVAYHYANDPVTCKTLFAKPGASWHNRHDFVSIYDQPYRTSTAGPGTPQPAGNLTWYDMSGGTKITRSHTHIPYCSTLIIGKTQVPADVIQLPGHSNAYHRTLSTTSTTVNLSLPLSGEFVAQSNGSMPLRIEVNVTATARVHYDGSRVMHFLNQVCTGPDRWEITPHDEQAVVNQWKSLGGPSLTPTVNVRNNGASAGSFNMSDTNMVGGASVGPRTLTYDVWADGGGWDCTWTLTADVDGRWSHTGMLSGLLTVDATDGDRITFDGTIGLRYTPPSVASATVQTSGATLELGDATVTVGRLPE